MLHANLMTMSCRTGVICRSKFYTALIGIFDLFRSCDLDLDPMTFVYELDPYSLEIYRIDVHELPTSSLLKVLVSPTYRRTHYAFTHTDKQTDRQGRNYIPRRFAGGQKIANDMNLELR